MKLKLDAEDASIAGNSRVRQRKDRARTVRTLERQCHRFCGSVVVITGDSVGGFGVLFVE